MRGCAASVSLPYLRSIGLDVGMQARAPAVAVAQRVPALSTSMPVRAMSVSSAATRASATAALASAAPAHGGRAASTSAADPAAAASRKFRVLALHGHQQSAVKFRGKIAAVVKQTKALAEYRFIDGPFLLPPAEAGAESGESFTSFTWFDTARRAAGEQGLVGVERSFELIEESDCDGIIAFSLGAAVLATILCHPELGERLRKRLAFVALFAGFVPDDPKLAGWMTEAGMLSGLPSFHCIGAADEVISATRSESLAARFDDPVVYRHEGGHLVPAAVRRDFRDFLASLPSR